MFGASTIKAVVCLATQISIESLEKTESKSSTDPSVLEQHVEGAPLTQDIDHPTAERRLVGCRE